MSNFYQDVLTHDPRFNSPLPCRDTALLEPNTRGAVHDLIIEAGTMGITLIPTETFRSAARQQALFKQGLSQLDGLTPQSIGTHHFGVACDFARLEGGKTDWKVKDWLFLGPLARKVGLVWGGDWGDASIDHDILVEDGFHDWDHVQLVTLEQQEELFAGSWYPQEK